MRLVKYVLSIVAGLFLYVAVVGPQWGAAMIAKAVGRSEPCPWKNLIKLPWSADRHNQLEIDMAKRLARIAEDPALGIQLFSSPTRPFWIKKVGANMDGNHLLAFVLAEQQWLAESAPSHGVRPGDIVVDIGAHIGTFGDDALHRGASKVIMIEPDPVNVECIRRNFKDEIAANRVIVIPEGAWNKADLLEFEVSGENSGMGSFVIQEGGARKIRIPVRPLDEMLRNIGIDRVDFIKMDIEGAEREALKGAVATLAKWKPRLMMDSYHLPDDDVVLPGLILKANPGYAATCAACSTNREASDNRVVPYAVFYE